MENSKVSVIIPTYKRPERLEKAVDSVLAQDYDDLEVIVVDDNNPDTEFRANTEKVMSKYDGNEKVKYVRHPENRNGSAARNTGFRNSSGNYIMFLDDDDEFMPGKIKAQKERLDGLGPEWGACYTTYVIRESDGVIRIKSSEKREGDLLVEELKRNLFIGAGSNLMIRRSVIEDVGGFDESFRRNQDQEFLTRILQKYKLAYTDIEGVVVNEHPREEKSKVDFDKQTIQYLETFKGAIDALPKEDREEVIKVITLQRMRILIQKKKDYKKARRIAKENGVSFWLFMRYMAHLAKRKITKKNYGFTYRKKKAADGGK